MKRNLLTSIAVATLVALAALPAARAATETWSTTPGSALWNATNWTGTNNPPLTGDSLIFGNSTLTTLTNDLTTSGFVINTLTFSAGAPAYTISGNAFTLGSQIVNSSSVTQTINDDIILSNASQSVMGNLTLGGTITSAGASTYINFGAGAVGTTTIKGSATIGANGFDVGNGATLKIDGASGNFSTSGSWRNGGNGAVIVTNGGSFNVAGDLWGALHSVTQDSGTVTLGTSSSNLLQYVTFATSGGTATINGQLYQGIKIDASGTAVVNLGASQSLVINDPAVTGVLSVAGSAAVTFANTLNLANTTSAGTINLNGGTLTVPGFYKTNTASATTFNFNGGTLKFSALNTVASTANTTFNVLAGGAVIDTQSYAVALQQRLLGASAGGLTKLGNGTLTLGGANTYTGTTTVNSGLIGLDVAENAGANGPLGNPATQANSIVLQGGGLQFTGNNTYDYTSYGRLQLADGFTGTIDTNGQSVTFANAIGVGALKTAALTKAGSGNLTLAAANTYTGATTVSAGTLKVGNATALSTSAVSVTSGAALDLNGTVMTGTNALTLNGTGITSGGALINSSATAGTYAGLITLGSASSIIAGTGNIAVSNPGTITGAYGLTLGGAQNGSLASIIGTGAGTLTKQDAGTWILSGANTYTGTTTVTGGLLNLNVAEIAGTSGPLGNSTAANSIVLQGGGLQFTSNNTYDYSGRLQLADASTGTINTNGQNVTFANAIGVGSLKTGALTKSGSGTLTLNAANTYTGTTTVSGGTLKVGNATALGTGTASVTSGAALDLNGTVMTGTNGLTLNGTGVNGSGALMNSSASAGTYAGLIALGSASSIIAGSGNITLSHAGTISGAYGLTLGGSKNGSIASIIGTGAGTLTKQDGGIWTLTGANTYTGATTISVGVLNIQNATALGTTAAGTTVAVGAALQLQNSITVGAEALTLNGAGINNDGALRNISGTNIWQGTVTLGSAARINSDSGSLTFNTAANSITGAFNLTLGGAGNGTVGGTITIGAGTLTKDGAGIWTLSGANTYTGATTVNGGLLQLNVAEIANTSGPLGKQLAAAANTIVLQGGGLQFTSNNTNDYSGRLQLADGFTGTIDTNGQNVAFATAIGVGTLKSGALTKAGTGTLTLTGNNTYNGKTLVSAGTLALGANLALQNSAIDTSGAGNITLSVTTPTFGGLIGSTDLTTVITSGYSSVTALTLNPSAGISNSYSGVIAEGAAGMTLTKSGAGTQILSGANTYNGTTTVSVGVLNIQNATALGTTANGTSVTSGAALQIQNNITVGAETLALNGTGIASNGALRNISGDNIWQGTVTLGSAARINSDSGSLTFNTAANSITGTQNLTLGGAGNGTIAGTITTSTGTLTKDGAGTWTLSGANTYTGTTTISGGTLDLGGGTANGSLASTVLSLGGGTLAYTRTGGTTQNFTGNTTINAGASSVTAAAGDTLNLGTITRNIGGTVDFGTTGSIITSTGNTTGILGGWATFGGTTWAVSNGASAITGLASYTNDIWAAANNTDVTGNSTQTGNTTNSLRFNATGANTLTLNGTNIITSGGILVTSAVGNNTTTITGGTLAGAASKDLVVIQNNTLNGLTIASTIANNTGATALTKSGAGALTLNATNTYTGGTYLNAGTLNINNAAALGTGTFVINGGTFDNTSGSAITITTNSQNWNNDFAFTGTNNLTFNTLNVTLGGAGTSRTITVNAGTLTIGGIIYAGTTANSLIKAGAGALTLSGANNTGFTGGVTLNVGTLNINSGTALGNIAGTFTINGGTIDNTSGAAITTSNYVQTWNSDFAFTGTKDLNFGTGAVNLGTTAGPSRTITSNAGNLTIGGIISNGAGGANSLIKAGNGALTLGGANTFTGGVTLNAGTLNINVAGALGSTIGTFTINGGTISTTNASTVTTNNYLQTWAGDFSYGFAGMGSEYNLNMGTGAVSLGTSAGTTRTITTLGLFGKLTEGGVISDGTTAKGITKAGPGTLLLTGANTFSGGITLNAGTLALDNATALGTGPLTINGGYLNNNGNVLTLTTNNTQAWNGDFTVTGFPRNYQPSPITFGNGAITLGGNRTVLNAGNVLTLPGAIGDGGSGYGVTWVVGLYQNFGSSVAMLNLSGASTYSGATVIQSRNNGVGVVAMSGTLANTSSVTVNGGGYFQVDATAANPINPNATLTLGGNGGGIFRAAGGYVSQSFTSLTVGTGADVLLGYYNQSVYNFTGANPYLRSVGGVVRINSLSSLSFTSAPSGAANVIGSGATAMLLGATWSSPFDTTGATNFVKSASGAITTLTSASNSWGTGINTDVLAGSTATGTVSQSLRFNAGGSLTLPAAFTVESGGILATTSTAAPVTITGTSIKTGLAGSDLWVVQGGPSSASTGMVINSQIIDNAGSSLTKVGQRALYLTNTNNTYAGGTYIGDGILNVASEGSLGSGALNFTGGSVGQINFAGGATLQAAGDIALGTRAVTIGQGVSATFDTNGHNISVGGPISGAYSSLYKTGVGTLTLGGANTYTGFTDVTNGTLALDFSAAGAPVSDIINANSLVNLGSIVSMGQPVTPTALSDTLSIQGKAGTANSQSFSGVSPNPLFGSVLVNQGMSHLNLAAGSGGTLTVNLGSLTRSLSGASLANIGLDIAIGSGVTVTTTTSLTGSGLLGTASTGTSINNVPPWVTVNGSSWATLSGNNIIPLADSSYSTIPSAYIGTGNNCDLRASATLTGANTLQSLRFNDTNTAGADVTLTLAGPSVPFLESIYGILVTSHVGAHTSTIASTGNGGFLLGFGPDLPIFQNNTAGDLVISAQRVDTNQAAALSKFGAGRLILTGLNTNTGATYVNEGTVIATGDYTPQVIKTGVLTTTGSTAVTMSDTSGLFLGQVMTGTGMRGGGWSYQVITAINPGVGITLSGAPQTGGNITATFQSGGALGGSGLIGGNGGVAVPVMIGTSGTLQIGNGGTHGSLDPNYTISNLGAFVLNRSDSYNFGNLISGSVVDNSLAGTGNTNTLEITGGNGTGTTTLGFSGTVNGSGAAAQKIYTLTTAGNVYVGQNVTGTNIAANTTVAYVDGLNVYFNNNIATGGATNVTFSTANTYAGTTKITGGSTLLLGSSTALQLSTLNYNTSDNGTLSFGSLTAATLGGLNGDKTLALTNNATAAVALTVGGNQLNTTYSGNLTGTGGSLIKTGIGTLTLSGTNSYTGNTTISQGMLQIGNVAALGTSAGAVSVTANASLDLNGTTIANTNTLALNGSGISGGALTNTSATGATYAGTVTLGSATSIGGTGDITLSLALGTDAFALTKVGADTLTLNGAGSSRTGAVAILNGTVKLGNAAALGTTAVTTTVSSGAALDINAQAVGAQALTLNGQYSSTIGALTNSGAAGSYAGTVALGSASSIGGAGNITLSNAISGAFGLTKVGAGTLILTGATNTSTTTTISSGTLQIGNAGTAGVLGSGAVTDNGTLAFNRTDSVTVSNAISGTGAVTLNSGTLTLGGANTYSGATTVNAGTLKLGAAGALGNGTSNTSGVTVSATGAAFDLNGTTPTATVVLTLNGTGVSSAGALTNSGAATTYAGTVALGADSSIGGAGNITLSNAISGAYGLTKVGAGTLILTGATNGSTTTTISSGTLQIGNAGTAGSLGTGAVTDNGTLVFNRTDTYGGTVSNQIGGTGAVTVNGGTLSLSGANNFAGGVALNVGTLNINNASALGTGTFVITGGTTIDNTSGSAITTGNNAQTWNGDFAFTGANNLAFGTGAVSLGAAAGTRTITVNAGTLTEGGVISSSGGAGITKAGAGALTLSGANTFGGGFILNAGTVNINNSAALGSSSAAFTINGGTIDNTSGAAITTSRYALTLNSDFAFTGTNNLSIGDLYGTVSLGTTAGTSRTITANAGTLALNGVIGNGTTANSLIKAGAGALTLSNANTFTGGMTLNAGTLNINNAAALGTTAGTFTINGGTLAQTANVQTFVTSNYVQAWNGDFGYSGNASMTSGLFGGVDHLGINLGTGAVTLGGTGTTRTITTDGYYGNLIVGGVISNGVTANSLIKNGTGILTLNAANAFTGGITLNAGTLRIGNAAALGNGTLTINGGSLAVNAASFTLSTNNAQVWNGAFSFRPINSTDQWTGGNNLNMGTGAVTLAGNSTVTTVNNYLTEGGAIGDGGNNYGVTWVAGYNGVGPRITLTGASTYHGATVVQSQSGAAFTASNLGMVVMTTGTLANTSSVTVNGGGYFQVGTTNSTNPINPLATLTLGGAGGGVFDFGGGSTGGRQSFTSLTVGSGTDVLFSYLVNSGPSIAFTGANPYTRSVGGVLHYVNLAGSSFTNAPSGAGNVIGTGANAILMGATYSYGNGGSTTDANYFVKAGNGTLTAATASAGVWGTGVNTDVLAGSGAIGSVSQSLRFNTGGSLTLPGAFTVESGGILATHNTAIPVTITGGTLATGIAGSDLWVVQGYYASATTGMIINSQIIDNGGSSLTKSGPRALYLTNTNNTYAGGTYLADGILNVASAGSLGSGALNFTGNANLQAAGNVALGSRAVTIASGLTATLDTNGHAISVGGVVSGVNASLTKTGLGTLTLTGANTYTGITTVQNGTLSLDFSASGAPASDIINANSLLQLGVAGVSDTLIIQGAAGVANSQTFGATNSPLGGNAATTVLGGMNNLVFNAGAGGSLTVNLGNISGGSSSSSYMDVSTSGNVTVAGVNDTTPGSYLDKGFHGSGGNNYAWATVNKSTWATVNTSGNLVGFADSSYTKNTATTIGGMADIVTSGTFAAGSQAQTLRFNDTLATGAGQTLTLNGTKVFQITSGAILMTANAGAHDSTISGGFLTGSNLTQLGIFQNNTLGNLIINSQITDQAGSSGFFKNGAGTVILNGVNVNSASFNVLEGTVIATGNYTQSSVKTIATTLGSNVVTMSDTTGLFIGQEITPIATYLPVPNGGLPNVVTAINPGVSVTISNNASANGTSITAAFQSGGAIGGAAFPASNIIMPSVNIANGATLQIGSAATGNSGGIDPNVTVSNLGALILSHSGNYTFGNTLSGAVATNSLSGTNATNTLEIAGGGSTTLGFNGTVNGSGVAAQNVYTLSTVGNVYKGQLVTGTNIPGGTYVNYVNGLSVTLTNNISTGGASNVTFTTVNTFAGTTNITGGSTLTLGSQLALQNSTLNYTSTGTLSFGTLTAATLGGLSGDKALALTNASAAAVALTVGGNLFDTAYSGNLTGTGGSLTKTGIGSLALSGTNTFTGGTTVSAGTLQIGSATALGDSTSAVSVASGATLDLNGQTVTNTNALTLNGSGFSIAALTNSSATGAVYAGNVTMTGAIPTTIGGSGNITLNGILTGGYGYTPNKVGTGTLILNGANTFAYGGSGFTISAGTVQLGNATALGLNNNVVTVASGAVLDLNGQTVANNYPLTINGTGINSGGALVNSSGTAASYAGTVALGAASSIGGVGAITLSNTISGSYGLTKIGADTLTLSGANTYTGKTDVLNGTVSFTTGNASATGAQSLGANATLDLGVASTSSGILKYTGTGGATLAKNINALGNGSDTIQNSGTGLLTLTGTLTKNGTVLTLKGGTGGITVSGTGTIAGSNAGSDLVVDGGTTTLATANTYNGPTSIINGATLNANAAGALPAAIRSAVSIDPSGSGNSTLALGANQTVASLTGGITSAVHLNANTLTVGTTTGTTTFAGVISGPGGSLIKDGNSTLVLTAANTFNGTTTVSEGTLEAGATGALGNTAAITVTTTGTLLLSANSATSNSTALTLNGGKVEIKTGTGINTALGALTLTDNSIIDFGLSSGTDILTLGAVTSWTATKTIQIWNWTGTPRTPGGNEQLMVSSTSGWTANLSSINFYTDSGTTLVGGGGAMFAGYELVAVPEPATWSYMAAIALGGAVLVLRRRRLVGIRN